jgi:hypothetical protein
LAHGMANQCRTIADFQNLTLGLWKILLKEGRDFISGRWHTK